MSIYFQVKNRLKSMELQLPSNERLHTDVTMALL